MFRRQNPKPLDPAVQLLHTRLGHPLAIQGLGSGTRQTSVLGALQPCQQPANASYKLSTDSVFYAISWHDHCLSKMNRRTH